MEERLAKLIRHWGPLEVGCLLLTPFLIWVLIELVDALLDAVL